MPTPKHTILVAALDWGLGHATRLIPVIELLEKKSCNVLLAASGNALQYWQQEFPSKEIIELPAYNPVYHDNRNMSWSMLLQSPKFFRAIAEENRVLKQLVKQHSINGIISDNRYGFYHEEIPSVLITHQIYIQTSKATAWLQPILKTINHHFIGKFNFCWIPDVANEENLSGKLSHHAHLPSNCRYIGLLSRLKKIDAEKVYDIALLLSGPEPQRTVLENILWQKCTALSEKIIFIRGTDKPFENEIQQKNITVNNLLTTDELNVVLNQSGMIVCRSGYSSVMDLVRLQKPALLIPTPGQTEQEYLATYLKEKKWFYFQKQNTVNLKEVLNQISEYFPPEINHTNVLQNAAIDEFLNSIG